MWFEQLVAYVERAEAPSVAFLRKFATNEAVFAQADAQGNTLLHHYCRKHPLDVAVLCLFRAMESDFARGNAQGVTPLHLMAQNGSATVELLQLTGLPCATKSRTAAPLACATKLRTRSGYTPLHHYCLQPHFDPATFRWLLARSDPAATTVSGNGVAHLLAMNRAVPLPLISDFLRAHGGLAGWTRPNLYGETPLNHLATYRGERRRYTECPHDSIEQGDATAIQDMIALGAADLNYLLCLAAETGHKDIAELLLDAAADGSSAALRNEVADPNTIYEKRSALQWAALHGRLEVAQLLVERGAAINSFDVDEYTPLDQCMYRTRSEALARYLKSEGAVMSHNKLQRHVERCCERGRLDLLKFLHEEGANVAAGESLHIAAKHGHLQIVEFLLEKGADVNRLDSTKWTSMERACEAGHLEVAQLLYARGSYCRREMLHVAAGGGHVDVLEWLLPMLSSPWRKKGSKLDTDHMWEGTTPLYRAAAGGHSRAVQLLLEKGADRSILCGGLTAAQDAERNGHVAAFELLR